jgi:hypothetical protein
MTPVTSRLRRHGIAGLPALLVLPVLLLLAGLVFYVGLLRDSRTETQNGADAASLAAARALATDDLLTNDPERTQNRVRQARAAAVTLARMNFAGGEQLQLDPNELDDPEGDIVLGHLDRPLSGTFEPLGADRSEWIGHRINAVRITARRSPVRAPFGGNSSDRDVLARSTAMLDWNVVGFLPKDDSPVPLIPIGVFTDHLGELSQAWDTHFRKQERDEWRFNSELRQWVAEPDGIPEITIVIGRRTAETDVPACFIQVGVQAASETVEQIRSGLNRDQLRAQFGTSGFVLGLDNSLQLPGSHECPGTEAPTRSLIDESLQGVVASCEPRIWPLFSGVNEEDGSIRVTGWMGARIVACGPAPGGGIALTLQPAVICHPSVVTEQRQNPSPFWAGNRTVCRVRLAE